MKEYKFTPEQIEAVRIVCGYDPDLHVELDYDEGLYEKMFHTISENFVNFFGKESASIKEYYVNGEIAMTKWDEYQLVIDTLVMQVVEGK